MRHFKTFLLFVLVCAMLLPTTACTKPDPKPAETTVDTESETETETRPEINLPTDPDEIVALIDSIPKGDLENEEKIDLAHAAWAALSEEDRTKVTNYDTLRTRLQELADAYIVKEYLDDRIPHGQLVLGVYYAHYDANQISDQHMQDLVDAHVDMAWAVPSLSKEFLDIYEKYGMGVIARGGNGMPVWRAAWMGEGYGILPTVTPGAAIESIPNTLNNDHPAIWGLDLTDEPGSNNFWWFNRTMPTLQNAYKVQSFANMHPSYGGPGPLGTYSYLKFVRNYATLVPGDIMSYDFYVYAHYFNDANNPNKVWLDYLNDLSIQSEACADTDRDLVVIMQLNQAPWQNQSVTLEQLKYQAYSSMAFGNKYVVWACYARNWSGGWHDGALDLEGNKTNQYYRMKDCNADLVEISPIYMRYTAKEQTMLNADPSTSAVQSFGINHPLNELGQKTITDLQVAENKDVLVGFYEKNIGEGEAFMLVNNSDLLFSEPITTTVSFRTVSAASIVTAYVKGVPTILDPVDGVYTIQIKDADAVFVTVTEPESINSKPAPAAPIGQLTVAGTDISDFTVVIPAEATARENQAAESLVALIEKATGKTLSVVSDDKAGSLDHVIALGKTALSPASLNTAKQNIKADGYVIMSSDGNLYITGNDADGAGTLFGVYGFAEDYLGFIFYNEKNITVKNVEKVAVPDGLNEISNPAFAYREATFYSAIVQPYPLYQKYNGKLLYGDKSFAAEWWAGESLFRLAGVAVTDTVCLTSEDTYATVLKNARLLLECDPDADFLSCSIGQAGDWNSCPCDKCTKAVNDEGTPMGLLLTFVNRLAADLAADYPGLLVETFAIGDLSQVPATVRPADNVAIRIAIPETVCHFHALNDTSCEENNDIRTSIEEWTKVCDNVIVLNNEIGRGAEMTAGANIINQYDTIAYLRELGVMGYQHTGHDTVSGEFGELRNYLMSRLLWDADMTREEYLATMDDFLKIYYGEGWTYVRQYIDKMCDAESLEHSDYANNLSMIYRVVSRDTKFSKECLTLLNSALSAATEDEHKYNVERTMLHVYRDCVEVTRDREMQNVLKSLANKYGFKI